MTDTTTPTKTTTAQDDSGDGDGDGGGGGCGVFERMSDWLVAECVLPWLVARPPYAPYFAAPRLR
jgi:hypothetical protein